MNVTPIYIFVSITLVLVGCVSPNLDTRNEEIRFQVNRLMQLDSSNCLESPYTFHSEEICQSLQMFKSKQNGEYYQIDSVYTTDVLMYNNETSSNELVRTFYNATIRWYANEKPTNKSLHIRFKYDNVVKYLVLVSVQFKKNKSE